MPDSSKNPVHTRDLHADPQNRRTHTPRNIEMIAASLRAVGAGRSIVIDENGGVLAGNGLLEGAAQAGLSKVQVVDADGDTIIAVRRRGLTPAQKRDLALFDNRTAELAEWDLRTLEADLKNGEDLSKFFFDAELQSMFGLRAKPGLTDPDAIPPERATGIVAGDLFQLGAHLLLCGDSTSAVVVARLLQNQKADMVWSDPPYNIAYNRSDNPRWRKNHARVTNDAMTPAAWRVFCGLVVDRIVEATNGCVYVCHAPGPDGRVMAMSLDAKLHASTTIIWVKDRFTLGRGKYQSQYEPIWFGWVKDGTKFTDARDLPNVWRIERPASSPEHPTMKPVSLVERAIAHGSRHGEMVIDLFGGSGSTAIACERLSRRCCVIEIEPRYVQVIIDRLAAFSGLKAVKVGEAARG